MANGEDIKLRYLPKKNPEEAAFPGVPLRDLTEDEFAAQPQWVKDSLVASSFYEVAAGDAKPAAASEKAKRSHKKKVAATPEATAETTQEAGS